MLPTNFIAINANGISTKSEARVTEDETNNFKVVKPYRGTIEEVKTTNPKDPKETKTKNVLGQTLIEW